MASRTTRGSSAVAGCRSSVTTSPLPPKGTRSVQRGPTNGTRLGRPTPPATMTGRTWPATRRPAAPARARPPPASTVLAASTKTSTRRRSHRSGGFATHPDLHASLRWRSGFNHVQIVQSVLTLTINSVASGRKKVTLQLCPVPFRSSGGWR